MRGWWNWQTRRIQNPVAFDGREGSSPSLRTKIKVEDVMKARVVAYVPVNFKCPKTGRQAVCGTCNDVICFFRNAVQAIETIDKGDTMTRRGDSIKQTPDAKFAFAKSSIEGKERAVLQDIKMYCWVDGTNAPTQGHATEAEAKTEAARLAVQNPGKKVHVLRHVFESVASVTTGTVVWE